MDDDAPESERQRWWHSAFVGWIVAAVFGFWYLTAAVLIGLAAVAWYLLGLDDSRCRPLDHGGDHLRGELPALTVPQDSRRSRVDSPAGSAPGVGRADPTGV